MASRSSRRDSPGVSRRDSPGVSRRTSPRQDEWQPRRSLQSGREVIVGDAVLAGDPTHPVTPSLAATSAARLGGRAIALAGLVVVSGVVLSRLLGWVRVAVFAAEYGTGPQIGAFFVAFRIPDTLFQLVAAGAVGSALVPVASALMANGEDVRARRLVATIANLMVVALVPLAIVVWFAAPAIVPIIDSTSSASQLALEIELTRWMMISPIFLAMAAAFTAGLNAAGVFGAPALAPNVYNLAIIGAAVVLTPFMGIEGLAAGVVLGAAGHMGIQAVAVRKEGLYGLVLDVHDPAVKETLKLMAPRALGLGVTQIVFLVNTFFAVQAHLGAAGEIHGIDIYTYAFTALQIPVGLIGVPLGIVLLPPLSQAIARGDRDRFGRLVDQALRLTLYVVVPLTGLMLVLATPTIGLLYQRGSFSPEATSVTVPVFVVFLLGLVAHVLISLLAPIFYAGKDTRTPVTAALLAVAVDVVAAALLFPFFGLVGLALAIGLGAWAEVSMLFYFMRHRIGFDLQPLGLTVAFAIPGATLAAAGSLGVFRGLDGLAHGSAAFPVVACEVAISGLAGLAVYLGWSRLLRLTELSEALALVKTVLRRAD